jgi:hypothetical protein
MFNLKYILNIIEKKYSYDHPFKNKNFTNKPILYQLAYLKLICDVYLNNTKIIDDYLKKKLISIQQKKFNIDLFNRNMSEYIFFEYILLGMYVKSDLYLQMDKVEYEPITVNNKKLEYSFILKNGFNINIEVKTIDCDPFLTNPKEMSKISLKKEYVYIKKFFKGCNKSDMNKQLKNIFEKNDKLLKNKGVTELKSNCRQVNGNIKKIKEKFSQDDKFINIGVLVINYGTSREEFFSYILNKHYGILKNNDLNNIDDLVLFSNTHITSFSLNEIYETGHIFSFNNSYDTYKKKIFEKLRLDNYIIENGKLNQGFSKFENKLVGVYIARCIMDNGKKFPFVLPYYISYDEEKESLHEIDNSNESIFNYNIQKCSCGHINR